MEEGGLKEKCPETYTCHSVKTIEMKRLHSFSVHAAEEKRIMTLPKSQGCCGPSVVTQLVGVQ